MPIDFSHLFDPERLRAIWKVAKPSDGVPPTEAEMARVAKNLKLPPNWQSSHIPFGRPGVILAMLLRRLRRLRRRRSRLLGHLLYPLRAAVDRLDPQPEPENCKCHPLARAASGSTFSLIDRLDDTLTAMKRQPIEHVKLQNRS